MLDVALECKPDEALMKALGFSRKEITHQPNKGEVFNYLRKNHGAIGMVDEDPGSPNPRYFDRFIKKKEQFGLAYYETKDKSNKLIVVKPRLEEWIINTTKISEIDPISFSLPQNGHQLHKIINTKLDKFSDLLQELLRKENEALLHLGQLIRPT